MEIEEIIDKLFGEIQPLCETNEDNERFENLYTYQRIYDYLTNELIECAKWKNDYRYSAKKIGKKAYEILKLNYEQIENELMEE